MSRILFNAKPKQIQVAAALAANAAIPIGMGLLHYDENHEFTADEMKIFWRNAAYFNADYVQGRCTKFWVRKPYQAIYGWQWMTGYETQADYETWYGKYATYKDLLEAAGITKMEVIE